MTKYDMVWHDKAGYGMAKEYFESMAQYNKEGNGMASRHPLSVATQPSVEATG